MVVALAGIRCVQDLLLGPSHPRVIPTKLVVSPESLSIRSLHDSIQIDASAQDDHGAVAQGLRFTWASSDTTVVKVDSTGLAISVTNGDATITAALNRLRDSVRVTVAQIVASVAVTPEADTIRTLGRVKQLSAEAQDSNAYAVVGKSFIWSSNDSNVATVDQTGAVTARRQGTAIVMAMIDSVTGAATTVVLQVPESITVTPSTHTFHALGVAQQYSAAAVDSNANTIIAPRFTWSSSDTAVATVDTLGSVSSRRNGSATITASLFGPSGSATATVNQVVATLTVSPQVATLLARGATRQLTVVSSDSNGFVVADSGLVWSSSDSAIAKVSGTGLVTALKNGTTAVRATLSGVADSTEITVTGVPARVVVTPSGATITSHGGVQAFTAQALDESGTPIAGKTVVWSVLNPYVATIALGSGVATGLASGQVTVAATTSGVTGYGVLTVAIPGATPASSFTPLSLSFTDNLRSVWGTTPGDVFVVGEGGTILHYDGSTWARMNSGTSSQLNGVWGTSNRDVFAVGDNGTVLHFDGTGWRVMSSGVSENLRAVWGSSPEHVVAVGGGGSILTFDGVGWVPDSTVTTGTLTAIWGASASDLFVTGSGGTVLHFDSQSWVPVMNNPALELAAIWGTAGHTVFAGGQTGVVRYDGASWTISDTVPVEGIAGTSSSDVYAASGAQIRRFNGIAWSSLPTAAASIHAIAGGPGTELYAVGGQGAVLRTTRGVASVKVVPAALLVDEGDTVRLLAAALDDNGDTLRGVSLSWVSTDTAVAVVDASGLVRGKSLGTVAILAGAEGKSGTASVGVQLPIAIEPFDAGGDHTCGVDVSGSTYCWGGNLSGEVGDGTTTLRATPVSVNNSATFVAVTAGGAHSCGLTGSGVVYCWGSNSYGQLGDGTTTDRSTPVLVSGAPAFRTVSAGESHTCGVTKDGVVYCWGANRHGQLGDGTTTGQLRPKQISGTLRFRWVAGGREHSCGLTADSLAYCWGGNRFGQLGNGALSDSKNPSAVQTSLRFRTLGIGAEHSCGIAEDGSGYCWGDNRLGQLGVGPPTNRTNPVSAAGGLKLTSIGAGESHTCAIALASSTTVCWGNNEFGQLGNVSGDGPYRFLTAGDNHTCALDADGAPHCWGDKGLGQVGDGTIASQPTPTAVSGGLLFTSVSAGRVTTCGTVSGSQWQPYCWGDNFTGQLGNGSFNSAGSPVPVIIGSNLATQFDLVKVGYHHTCGRRATGPAYCWGDNEFGQLGAPTSTPMNPTPTLISSLIYNPNSGGGHSCGTSAGGGGSIECWGDNAYGQLGNNSTVSTNTPVLSLSGTSLGKTSGANHSCGIRQESFSKPVYCWGLNRYGQLGNGSRTDAHSPTVVRVPDGNPFSGKTVSAGLNHTCAITLGDDVFCWGDNRAGQLGDGTQTNRVSAVRTKNDAIAVTSGTGHSCAIDFANHAWCWGDNRAGQLGDGTTIDRLVPTLVSGAYLFKGIAAGAFHTCAITTGGAAYCWGSYAHGQLGNDGIGGAIQPVSVSGALTFRLPPGNVARVIATSP